jgi:superfamily I DNA and/or RNA helicase
VVVATANSGAIERMVLERSQFDAVIVEEAAKATGPELIGALSLSGRHLLIGDHNQLPPFDAERFERILRDHTLTLNALEAADSLLDTRFPDGELADLIETAKDAAAFAHVAGLAFRMVQFFSTVVKGDETRKTANAAHRALSTLLNEQRRMHPAIAEIVSEAFYEGKLRSAAIRIESAYSKPPNFTCQEPLPPSPVVVVNVPHVGDNGNAQPIERAGKRWNNPTEADAVLDVLRLVGSVEGENRPTLAILSPYSAQVELIQRKLSAILRKNPHFLGRFKPARPGLDFVGTVDSFQGAEADLVIVSMVRNNSKVGFSALGFLRDRRRINVLMSRAKLKLVLVTSLGFLRSATTEAAADQKDELSFLTTILAKLAELQGRTAPDGTALATVVPVKALRGGS